MKLYIFFSNSCLLNGIEKTNFLTSRCRIAIVALTCGTIHEIHLPPETIRETIEITDQKALSSSGKQIQWSRFIVFPQKLVSNSSLKPAKFRSSEVNRWPNLEQIFMETFSETLLIDIDRSANDPSIPSAINRGNRAISSCDKKMRKRGRSLISLVLIGKWYDQ